MALISVVVPIFNEQENLPELRRRVSAALDSTGELRQMNIEDPRIKVIDLSRNFGHQPAVTAGIHHARGDCVILIDGDLQDPPEVIPEMVKQWRAGSQVVLGERSSRT